MSKNKCRFFEYTVTKSFGGAVKRYFVVSEHMNETKALYEFFKNRNIPVKDQGGWKCFGVNSSEEMGAEEEV